MPEPTVPPSMTQPPTAPNRGQPTPFRERMDAFLAWIVIWYAELVAIVANVFANAQAAFGSATAAAGSATAAAGAAVSAASSAASAAALLAAPPWSALTVYAIGDPVWSPISGLIYRRRGAPGSGGADPSLDDVHWNPATANGLQLVRTALAAFTVAPNTITLFTNAGAVAVTAPVASAFGDVITLIFDNGLNTNTLDLGATPIKGLNGEIGNGVGTLDVLTPFSIKNWSDYWRFNV